jgi:hypothetical protein
MFLDCSYKEKNYFLIRIYNADGFLIDIFDTLHSLHSLQYLLYVSFRLYHIDTQHDTYEGFMFHSSYPSYVSC